MFKTPGECERKEYICTNPRYKGFCQTYFTAGDEEQFEETRDRLPITSIPKADHSHIWDGYKDISAYHVLTTFRYIFNKFKKGIFISIKNNKVSTFLPFSKAKFVNEWSDQIQVDPMYNDINEFFKHISDLEGRHFSEHKINKIVSRWYGNNCLIRYEFPQSENDTGVHHVKSMFEDLCAERIVPDIEIFVNRRDFPLLTRDGTEPYEDMWDSTTKPLVSHCYDKYVPILSSTTTNRHADIPIPTLEDWARIKFEEGFYFPKTHNRDYSDLFDTNWEDKKQIAVFRGASTGRHTTVETNPRLKVAFLSSVWKDDKEKAGYLDAGITDWNLRARKIQGEKYLQTIEIDKLPFGLVPKLTPTEQSMYKYIVHIDGHSSAFRLSLEFAMRSVILKVDSKYSLWFSHLIKPYEHYIPVKSDLSDLHAQIEWCRTHDSECKQIAENAYIFYKHTLSKTGILDFLQKLILSVRQNINYVYPQHPLDGQIKKCKTMLTLSTVNIVDLPVLSNNKLSTVYKFGKNILKHTVDPKKIKENIHEAFIGINCVNRLVRYTPYFVQTHGVSDKYGVISDHVEHTSTFFAWLGSNAFDFDEYICILYQLSAALVVAQTVCGFVHNDLFPWNVLLKSGGPYECVVNSTTVLRVRKNITVPVIIDYGKSHVIYKGEHYGFINMYKFNSIYDVFCILMSSLAIVLRSKKITNDRDNDLLKLVNFISETQFCPQKFKSFTQVRQYVFDNSSFSTLITLDLKDLSNFTPIDFCRYLSSKFTIKGIEVATSRLSSDRKIPTSENIIKKKLEKCLWEDKLFVYYFFQCLEIYIPEKMLTSVTLQFEKYLENSSFKDDYNNTLISSNIDDTDYLRGVFPCSNIPTMNEYTLNMVLTYKGIFELSPADRAYLNK
jgi:hypothetical protein